MAQSMADLKLKDLRYLVALAATRGPAICAFCGLLARNNGLGRAA